MLPQELNVYHFEPEIQTLGPGLRSGLWLQGCRFACPGCLVPDSWSYKKGLPYEQSALVDLLQKAIDNSPTIRGLTISGGEPLEQLDNLQLLIDLYRNAFSDKDIIIYTGYYLEEAIKKFGDSFVLLMSKIDVLIDGRFEQGMIASDGIRGSSNQKVYFAGEKISASDLKYWGRDCEYIVHNDYVFRAGVPFDRSVLGHSTDN